MPDRFLVFLAALSLLTEVGELCRSSPSPTMAHRLDDASAAALLVAARRLRNERVAYSSPPGTATTGPGGSEPRRRAPR